MRQQHRGSTRSQLMGLAPLACAALVIGTTRCGLTSATNESEPDTTAAHLVSEHAEPETGLVPWEDVQADVYDTVLGAGFGERKFVDHWGDFGADGRHRPDVDALFGEALGRELLASERSELEVLYDEHESMIREAALAAYHTLHVALDDVWQSGRIAHLPAADPASREVAEAAYQDARELGGYTYCDTFTTGGWQVQVLVPSPDYPEFHHAFKELRRAVLAREADARRSLGIS